MNGRGRTGWVLLACAMWAAPALVTAAPSGGMTDTASADPASADPASTDPASTDPASTDPAPPELRDEDPRRYESVVTGTRTERLVEDSVVPTEVLTRRDIERSGARDVRELLETHAGVEFERTSRGEGIRLQGLDSSGVIILLDGHRIAGRVGGLLDLARLPIRELERVEIIKGPGSALYGSDAMAGIIHLITRSESAPREAMAAASYGMRDELDLRGHAALRGETVRARVGGGRRTSAPYDLDVTNAATSGPGTGGFDVNGLVQWEPTEAFQLRVSADYLWKDTHAIDALGTGALFDRRRRNELFDGSIRSTWKPRERSRFTLSARHSNFRDQLLQDQRASQDLDQYEDAREALTEGVLQWDESIGERHVATVGLEQSVWNYRAHRLLEGGGDRLRTAVFAQDEWRVSETGKITLLPGARGDLDSQFGFYVSPRIALSARPIDALQLRLAWGQGFRAPSFEELLLSFSNAAVGYVVEGNPNLRPEQSNGVTLSADYAPRAWVQFAASVFHTRVTDLISIGTLAEATADTPTRFGYLNIARARSTGGEVSARLRLAQSVWLDTGYSLTDARDEASEQLLEGRSVHRVTSRISGRIRPLGIEGTVSAAWSGPRRFNGLDGADVWAPAWVRLDANLRRRMWTHLSLFAGARNLLDAGDATYLPIAPRQLYAGLEVEL